MSIVRYKNKKTGKVAVYESTSFYDPILKQSRPKRKYLGTEDPETGELIPSSGKRGRKKGDENITASSPKKENIIDEYKEKYEKLLDELRKKENKIKELERYNKKLLFCIQNIRNTTSEILDKNIE